MNNRKLVAAMVAASLVVGTTVAPRRAEAGFGLLLAALTGTATGALNLGSIIFFAGSVGGGLTAGHFARKGSSSSGLKSATFFVLAGISALGAIYLLDAPGTGEAALAPMSEEAASRLGVSPQERAAYDAELPQINALREEVMARASRELESVPDEKLSVEMASLAVRRHWLELSHSALSPEAARAVEAVGRSLANHNGGNP